MKLIQAARKEVEDQALKMLEQGLLSHVCLFSIPVVNNTLLDDKLLDDNLSAALPVETPLQLHWIVFFLFG